MGFEISEIRRNDIESNDLKNLDSKFRFYYDETNNIRKFSLQPNKFNESINTNFVLGGILLEDDTEFDLQPLFNGFGLQRNIVEVKLSHLAKGNFIECLKSIHLQSIFKYLSKNRLFIHYSSLNFLYYSIVDIIDSLSVATEIYYEEVYNRALKNDFYLCLKKNKDHFVDILYKFEYPNIKLEKADAFLEELINIFDTETESIGTRTILMLLKESKKNKDLVFIMNEKNHELIEDFKYSYIRQIYLFINSEHIFDEETTIERLVNELDMTYENNKINNFTFIDSKVNKFIQLSDIITGLIGKFYNFLNENSIEDISKKLLEISNLQKMTFNLFIKSLQESEKQNKAYAFLTISNDEIFKLKYIYNWADNN